jgi:hypothetical protein
MLNSQTQSNQLQSNQLQSNQTQSNQLQITQNNYDDDTLSQLPYSEWSPDHEKILVEWADKAMCYRWLHAKSHTIFSKKNAWYTIPVIIISTLTGTANFAQERVPIEYRSYFAIIIGAFSILAGIITTIQQFLKITQLNEAHRVSSIAWDKFYRNIKTELAKHPTERIPVLQMLKMCKEEFDRLIETSPSILDEVIETFKHTFEGVETFKGVAKPEICDVMIGTNNYRNPWYTDENKNKELKIIMERKNNSSNEQKKQHELLLKTVMDFKQNFINLNNRDPLDTEIITNLKDTIEMTALLKIIEDDKLKNQNIV